MPRAARGFFSLRSSALHFLLQLWIAFGGTRISTLLRQFSHITWPADISGPVGSTPLSGSSRRHWNISWSKPLKAHAPCVMHIHHACSTVVLGLVLVATGSCDVPRRALKRSELEHQSLLQLLL